MREDLNKLMCEHERARSSDNYGNYRHLKDYDVAGDIDNDGEPFAGVSSGYRESMKARYAGGSKSFSENLNPLFGFIRKSVGKPWDDVYSEICKGFDKRSVINQHILIHLFQYVEIKGVTIGNDGKLWYRPTQFYSWRDAQLLSESHVEYYVDPRDGILKKNHDHKTHGQVHRLFQERLKEEEAKVRRVISETTEVRKLHGCWFEIKFEDIEGIRETKISDLPYRKNWLQTTTVFMPRYDVLAGCTVAEKRVAVSKRQLCHRDLRKYGLTNETTPL